MDETVNSKTRNVPCHDLCRYPLARIPCPLYIIMGTSESKIRPSKVAHRRGSLLSGYREREMATGKRSHAVRRQISLKGKRALGQRYPQYVIPLRTLLTLQGRFQPHQVCLRKGWLRKAQPGQSIIFVSHQWVGYSHPDAEGVQLRSLQTLIKKILDGKIKQVEMYWLHQIMFVSRSISPRHPYAVYQPHAFDLST